MIHEVRAAHRRRLILVFLPTLLACAICYAWLDRPTALWWKANLGPAGEAIFRQITRFGDSKYELVPAALVWLIWRGRPETRARAIAAGALFVFLSVAASGLFVDVVKIVIGRHRPYDLFSQGLYGFAPFHAGFAVASFPSGHTQTAFAAAMPLARLLPRWRWWWLGAAILIAISRVVLGEHYLADVLMGAWVGWAGAVLIGDEMQARGLIPR